MANLDLIRIGYVSAVNYEKGTAKVIYRDRDNAVSPDMPFLSNEYNMPEIDDQVIVLVLPNGSTSGVILGKPFHDKNRPEEGRKGIWRKDFGDGNFIQYDYGTKSLVVGGSLAINGNLRAESISTTGNVHVGGNLTVIGSYPG